MTRPTKQLIYDTERPDYSLLADIARNCSGWIRSSGGNHGEEVNVWHGDTEYIFRGQALVRFLYACKDDQLETINQAKALVEYIEKAEKQPPSVFVRDAIVARAKELKERWGE